MHKVQAAAELHIRKTPADPAARGYRAEDLDTPAIVLDLDILENNIRRYAELAKEHGKQLWPMVKTHKSLEIARLQAEAGCTGFLCGTLDEAEALAEAGYQHLMYAYPPAGRASVNRVIRLARKTEELILRLDSLEAAAALEEAAREAEALKAEALEAEARKTGAPGEVAGPLTLDYTVILDCGLHRFGLSPERIADFVLEMQRFPHLRFRGISTHPGQVYGAAGPAEIPEYCRQETEAIRRAVEKLADTGIRPEIVSSGSTPTFAGTVGDPLITHYHPGNYVFNDAIQLSNGTAEEGDCALRIAAAVISHPSEGHFVVDAGAKCLGLDQGAHGNSSVRGHGRVLGHPELTVSHLSEEVGQVEAEGETSLRIGDRVSIIPNHSCSSANLTDWYLGVRSGVLEQVIPVDMRGNRTTKQRGAE